MHVDHAWPKYREAKLLITVRTKLARLRTPFCGWRCGREGCRCAEGELHGPYIYITWRKPRGRGGLLYVPAELAALVRERIALTAQMQASLEEISEINLELLTRRQLD